MTRRDQHHGRHETAVRAAADIPVMVVRDPLGIMHVARRLPSFDPIHSKDIVFVAMCQLLRFSMTFEWNPNDASEGETNCIAIEIL